MALGIFIYQDVHYTAMIRREGITYHIDSRPVESGDGPFVYEIPVPLFAEYARHFVHGRVAPGGRRVGGMFRVHYVGFELLDVVMAA